VREKPDDKLSPNKNGINSFMARCYIKGGFCFNPTDEDEDLPSISLLAGLAGIISGQPLSRGLDAE
jgi:hypothetical protein